MLFTDQSSSQDWQKLSLPLGRIPSSYNLLIEAISSGLEQETIIVDEVKLIDCVLPSPCTSLPPSYFECENKACYPGEARCDFTDDCGDYSDEAKCGKCDCVDCCICCCHIIIQTTLNLCKLILRNFEVTEKNLYHPSNYI